MNKQEYAATLEGRLTGSIGSRANDVWTQNYRQALSDYLGLPYGNEVQDRSQVVSRDVQEVIEGMMPSLMRTFAGGSRVVEFEPQAHDDPENADQATELVNWFWNSKNEGYKNTYAWIKGALLNGLDFIKFWYEEPIKQVEKREAVDVEQALALGFEPDENGKIIVQPEIKDKTIRIVPCPPQEMRFSSRGGASIDELDFIAHIELKTRSELLELGVTKAQIEDLRGEFGAGVQDIVAATSSTYSGRNVSDYKLGYNDDSTYANTNDEVDDEALQRVILVDASVLIDKDGDGIAERRRVIWAGSRAQVILYDEEYDHVHFEGLSPILMPHALIGQSVAGQVKDIQFIKTGLLRNALDNVSQQVNPRRQGIVDKFNVDDATNPAIGTIERVKEAGALIDLPTPNIIDGAASMMGAIDAIREARTGHRKFGSMLDGRGIDAYSETAFGAGLVDNAANDRLDFIARTLAETGFRGIFKKLLKLIVAHWDEALAIRVLGEPVTIDPTKFDVDMDVVPVIGLGVASKQQKIAEADGLLSIAKQIIEMQGGLNGPFIKAEQAYNYLKAAIVARGHKNPDDFIAKPEPEQEGQGQQPPPPSPEMILAQAKIDLEVKKHKDEMDFKYAQLDKEEALKIREMDMEYDLKLGQSANTNIHSVASFGGQGL